LRHKNEVLIVGSTAIWALETYYCKHLNESGIPTTIFNCSQFFNSSSIIFKLRNRLGDLNVYLTANKELINYCNKKRPSIVWVFKGVELFPETLDQLKTLGIILVNYNPDHPFIRTSISHGGNNIPNSVSFYDLHFTYSTDLIDIIQKEYNIPTLLLPFGYELDIEDFNKIQKIPEKRKLCFIGTPDRARVKILQKIAEEGFEIDVYGQQYQNKYILNKYKNINSYDVVLGLDFWKKIREYRIQLNFFRQHNIESHNQRTFEVPGAGGILLSPDNNDQRNYFEAEKEMYFYNNIDEMIEKINFILFLSDKKINNIRNSARERSLHSGYSYKDRALFVSSTFSKYFWN
jgi:spore maturation protein CgeB